MSTRYGGIELEIGAFPCFAEQDNLEDFCTVDKFGLA